MAKPTLESFAQALYDSMLPMQYDEANQDYALAKFLAGIGTGFQQVEDYGRAQGDIPGWASLMDPDLCPPEALGWLAQFVGVTLQPGLSDSAQRAWVKSTDGWFRGTRNAIIAAAQHTLTGQQRVVFRERDGAAHGISASPDYAYVLSIWTYSVETPNPTATLNAILAQKPAGIVLFYNSAVYQDYQNVKTTNATYAVVKSTFSTYNYLALNQPG